MPLRSIIPESFGNVNNFSVDNPFLRSRQINEEYADFADPFYEVLDKNNKKAYEKIIEAYKDSALSCIRKSAYGNNVSVRKKEAWEMRNIDRAYKEYADKICEIIRTHIPDVKGYQYAEQWAIHYFYSLSNDYEDIQFNKMTDIALPMALCICDSILIAGRYEDLEDLLKDVKIRKETSDEMSAFADTVHLKDLLSKVVQVVYDHNRGQKNFNENFRFYGNYADRDESKSNYAIYKKMISLVPKEDQDELIDTAKITGYQMFDKCMKMIAKAINKLPERMKEADTLLKDLKECIRQSQKPDLSKLNAPLAKPIDIMSDEAAKLTTGSVLKISKMVGSHIRMVNDIETIRTLAYDSSLKYDSIVDSVDNQQKWLDETRGPIKDDMEIERISIENPYDIICGIILALERGESFPYIFNVYQQLFSLCIRLLPWNYNVSDKVNNMIEMVWCGDKTHCIRNLYDINYGSKDKEDSSSMNLTQLIYSISGIIPSRIYRNVTSANEYCESLDVKNKDLMVLFGSTLGVIRRQMEMIEISKERAAENVKDAAEKEASKKTEENLRKLKSEIDGLEKEKHDLSIKLQEAESDHDKLLKKYEADMKELAQLRENLFLSQNEKKEDEKIDEALPYRLRSNIAIYGGHEKWISRLKESLEGDIRIYPPNTTISKNQIANADIVYIQTKYIDHKTYYAVMDMLKGLDKKFVCLNTSSANNTLKIIIDGDKEDR